MRTGIVPAAGAAAAPERLGEFQVEEHAEPRVVDVCSEQARYARQLQSLSMQRAPALRSAQHAPIVVRHELPTSRAQDAGESTPHSQML
jgi:hypothetical protein